MGCNCSNGNEYISEMLNERQEIKQEEEKENEKTFIEDEGDIIINFEEEKVKLMDKLSLNGFFLNKDIKLIIENINPKVNSFKIPEEIKEKMKNINIIKLPLIKLNDGSIYEGCWNLNGQKEGFGIYIMISENLKEHLSYFGFWKNGKQDGYGIIIKNKKISYAKYKDGKKIAYYKNDIFIKEMLPFIDITYRKVFLYDSKSLRKIIKNIIYY